MNLFDIFHRKPKDEKDEELEKRGVKIEFGFREEGLSYQQADKKIFVGFFWVDGYKIYPDDIKKWEDGRRLREHEQEHVFLDLLDFVERKKGKPIVVISKDDASKTLWENLCASNNALVDKIEYTSDEEEAQHMRKQGLQALNSSGSIKYRIDGVEIKNDDELEKAIASFIRKKRAKLDG